MRIYRIGMYEKPTADRIVAMRSVDYAHFSALGTWVSEREVCKACGWHWQTYGPPLLVKWEPSSDAIGDFSWDGPFGYLFVVKEDVANSFRAMDIECRFLPVEYVAPDKKREVKSVPFPYKGPTLLWGCCDAFVDLDFTASNVSVRSSCEVCGSVRYTFRVDNIVIRRANWHGEKMFRLKSNGSSAATFVTEGARDLICRAGFSNVAFTLAGEIVE